MNTIEKNRKEMQLRTINGSFKTRAEDDGAKYIEGYFAVFNSMYEVFPGGTESIDPEAFEGALDGDIRALINHETRLVLGRTKAGTLALTVDERGLFGSIRINEQDSDAMNLYRRVERGDVDQCSFGFDIIAEEQEIRPDGSVHWTIKRVKLYEVSVATFPAYEDTSVSARMTQYQTIVERQKEKIRSEIKKKLEAIRNGA